MPIVWRSAFLLCLMFAGPPDHPHDTHDHDDDADVQPNFARFSLLISEWSRLLFTAASQTMASQSRAAFYGLRADQQTGS
jgi:hypothetical protein